MIQLPVIDAGVPWWAACLMAMFTALMWCALRALRILVPARSEDLLRWWIAVLRHRRLRSSRKAGGAGSATAAAPVAPG
ncbi:hypothetical protein ACFVQF_35230, partial [Streptomyces sp. NPDC057866]